MVLPERPPQYRITKDGTGWYVVQREVGYEKARRRFRWDNDTSPVPEEWRDFSSRTPFLFWARRVVKKRMRDYETKTRQDQLREGLATRKQERTYVK
jgi:hypothetical protein